MDLIKSTIINRGSELCDLSLSLSEPIARIEPVSSFKDSLEQLSVFSTPKENEMYCERYAGALDLAYDIEIESSFPSVLQDFQRRLHVVAFFESAKRMLEDDKTIDRALIEMLHNRALGLFQNQWFSELIQLNNEQQINPNILHPILEYTVSSWLEHLPIDDRTYHFGALNAVSFELASILRTGIYRDRFEVDYNRGNRIIKQIQNQCIKEGILEKLYLKSFSAIVGGNIGINYKIHDYAIAYIRKSGSLEPRQAEKSLTLLRSLYKSEFRADGHISNFKLYSALLAGILMEDSSETATNKLIVETVMRLSEYANQKVIADIFLVCIIGVLISGKSSIEELDRLVVKYKEISRYASEDIKEIYKRFKTN